MSDNIAIFLTVLASSCLGMYFYYNEQNAESEDSKDFKDVDDIDDDNEDDGQNYSEDQDIYFGKKIRKPTNDHDKSKSKRNKRSTKKHVSSRKTY